MFGRRALTLIVAVVLVSAGASIWYIYQRLQDAEPREHQAVRSSGGLGSVSSGPFAINGPAYFREGSRGAAVISAGWPGHEMAPVVLVLMRVPVLGENATSSMGSGSSWEGGVLSMNFRLQESHGQEVECRYELLEKTLAESFRVGDQAADLSAGRVLLVDYYATPPTVTPVSVDLAALVSGVGLTPDSLKIIITRLVDEHESVRTFWKASRK